MKLNKNAKSCNVQNVHKAFPCLHQFLITKNRSSHVRKALCCCRAFRLPCPVQRTQKKNLNNCRLIVRCREAPHGKLGRSIFILGIVCLRSTFNCGVGSDKERRSISYRKTKLLTTAKSNTWLWVMWPILNDSFNFLAWILNPKTSNSPFQCCPAVCLHHLEINTLNVNM